MIDQLQRYKRYTKLRLNFEFQHLLSHYTIQDEIIITCNFNLEPKFFKSSGWKWFGKYVFYLILC